MGWISDVIVPVRNRLRPSRANAHGANARGANAIAAAAAPAAYQLSRQWVEPLEARQLMTGVDYAGFHFEAAAVNAAKNGDLATLFSAGATGPMTVAYSGVISAANQTLDGGFSVTRYSAGVYAISATGLSLALPNNLLTLSNAGASLNLTGTGITGAVTGSLALSAGYITASLADVTLAWDTAQSGGDIKLAATGSLAVAPGQSLSNAAFTFERDGSTGNVNAAVTGAAITLGGGQIQATNLAGAISLRTAGLVASGSGGVAGSFTTAGATFTGTLGFAVDTTATDKNLKLTGTAVDIAVGNNSFTADVAFESITGTAAVVGAQLSKVSAEIGDANGNHYVTLASPADGTGGAAFLVQDGGFAGVIRGVLTVHTPGGVSAVGTGVLQINTGTKVVTFKDPADDAAPSFVIPAGPTVRAYARGLDLTLAADRSLSGDFAFELTQGSANDAAATTVTVTVDDANGTFGNAAFSNAAGQLTVGPDPVTGRVSGTATFAGGNVTVSAGAFSVALDSGGFHIAGTGVTLSVGGQSLAGDFTVEAGATTTAFTVANGSLAFGGELLSATNVSGTFTAAAGAPTTGDVAGTLDTTVGQAHFDGYVKIAFKSDGTIALEGRDDTLAVGDQIVAGSFTFTDSVTASVHTIAATGSNVTVDLGNGLVRVVDGSFTFSTTPDTFTATVDGTVHAAAAGGVAFDGRVTVSVSAQAITADGTDDTLTVAGQLFHAGFHFHEDAGVLELGVDSVNLSLADNALAMSNAAGTLVIPADRSGITGSLSAGLTAHLSDVTLTGTLDVTFDGSTYTLNATGINLTVLGQTVTGDVGLVVTNDGHDLDLTAQNLSATLGGGLVKITPSPTGSTSTLHVGGGRITGGFTGVVRAGTAAGASFTGGISVNVDTVNGITAAGTNDVLTIANQPITADFAFAKRTDGQLHLTVSGVNFALGSLIRIANAGGDLIVTNTGVTGTAAGTVTNSIAGFTGSLGVGFAPGVITVSGTNDKLQYGDQFVAGSFTFTKTAAGLQLSGTDFTASLGNGLVTVANGTGTLSVDANSGAIAGSFAGDVSAGTAAGVGFAGRVAVAVGGGALVVTGTNDTLTVAGTPLSTSFNFYRDAAGLQLKVAGLRFALGQAIAVSGASGTLTVDAAGVRGSTVGTVSSAVAGFTGQLGLSFAPGRFQLSGTNDRITIGDQSVGGDFTFTSAANGTDLTLDIANGTASLGNGLVTATNGTAHLSVVNGKARGTVAGTLAAGTAASVRFAGPVTVTVTDTAISAAGTGVTLTVAGQSVSGDVAIVEDATTRTLNVTLGSVSANVAGVLSVSNVNGTITVDAAGPHGTIAGTVGQSIAGLTADAVGVTFAPGSLAVSATNAALNVGGQSLSGDFRFTKDAAGNHLVSDNMAATLGGGLVAVTGGHADLAINNGTVAGTFGGTVAAGTAAVGLAGTVTVTVGGGAISVVGTNDTLTIGTTKLTTDLRLFKDAAGLELHVSNLNYALGDAIRITNAAGDLLVTPAGVTGQANGTVATNFAGVTVTGDLGVGFAPGTLLVRGTNNKLTAGTETVGGNFVFTKSDAGLTLTADNFTATLGGGLLTVTDGTGALSVGNSGVSGSFAGTIHAGTVGGGISLDGPIAVSVGNGTITAATPLGGRDTITVAGQTVSGAFAVTRDATGLDLSVSDLTASLGGGAVTLANGGGDLHVASAGVTGSAAGTLAAAVPGVTFTGRVAATFAPNSLTLAGTNNALTIGTERIAGDFTFAAAGPADVRLTVANLSVGLGNGLVTVANGSGYLTLANGTVRGGFAGTVGVGAGTSGFALAGPIRVDVAPGSITASTPDGQTDTITVAGQTLSAGFTFASDASGLALTMRDVNLSLGGGAVAVTNAGGTLRVTRTAVNGSVYGAIAANVPNVAFNSQNFGITFGGPALTVTGTNVGLTAYGQAINGNFTFAQSGQTVNLAVTHLGLTLGNVVTVADGTGTFTLVRGGAMTGTAGGTVAIAGASDNVRFGGLYSVSVGNNAVKVAGTGASLTMFGQTLTGNFAFAKQADATVNLHVSALNLSLGNGLVNVTGGACDFTLANGGITGTAAGTLAVGSTSAGVGFAGAVTVNVRPTAVDVVGRGVTFTVGGTRLSADVDFSQDRASGALAVAITNLSLSPGGGEAAVVVSGTLLVLKSGLSGTLTGRGSIGGANGYVTATFGNGTYQIAGGVSTSFNETLSGMTVSGTIAAGGTTGAGGSAGNISLTDLMVSLAGGLVTVTGGSATLNKVGDKLSGDVAGTVAVNAGGVQVAGNVAVHFTPTAITVTGTDDTITVLGQTIRGNFSFVDAGDGTVTINVSGLALSLGNTVGLTGGTAAFTLAPGGLKGSGLADVNVTLPGVAFGGAFGLAVDNTNGRKTLLVAANPMTVTVDDTTLTGSFAFQKTTTRDGTVTQSLVASDVNAFVGDGTTGVRVSNAGGTVLFLPSGVALDIAGTASLVGVTGLTMTGTLDVRINDTGRAVNETVPTSGGGTATLKLAAGEHAVAGTAVLAVAKADGTAFVSLSGGFSVTQQTRTVANTKTTKVMIGAAGLSAFLGADGTGLQVDNANLGLVLFGTTTGTAHTSTYALDASGTASLVGVNGLTLSGTAGVRTNTAANVDETVLVPDPKNPGSFIPVSVKFGHLEQAFSGTGLTLAVGDAVTLGGDFSFDKARAGNTSTVTVTGRTVTAFVGSGAVGLQLKDGSVDLTLTKVAAAASTYALAADAAVGVTGLPGLNVGGRLAVTASSTASPVLRATGLTFGVLDSDNRPVLAVSLDATIQKQGGLVDINATRAEMALTVAGQQLIDVQGTAEFTVGTGGFKLGPAGYRVTNFSILGGSLGALPSSIATPAGSIAMPAGSTNGGTTAPLPTAPTPVGTPRRLGPLSVYGLKPIFKDFSFNNGQLAANLGLQAATATLAFGGGTTNPGGTTATFVNLSGSLNLALGLNLSSFRVTSFGSNGKFALAAKQFILNVPNVVNASATDIDLGYDPNASLTQKILSIGSAVVTVPLAGGGSAIQGSITPYTTASGVVVPGLAVYGDHFQLGRATVKYYGSLGSGSVAQLVNPFVSISDLSASFTGGGLAFNGGITLGADSALIGPSSFRLTGNNIAATLAKNSAGDWRFGFTAGTLGLTISKLQLSATNVAFNPGATGSETLVSLSNLAATLSLSNFTVTGSAGSAAGAIVIKGDGSLSLPRNFTIGLAIGPGTSGALGWPSWVPIQLQSVVLTWPDFSADQADFTLTFSAAVDGQIGPVHISGAVDGVTIDIGKASRGEFPITGIRSAVVHADGNVFGGTINGTLLLGVIQLDATNHQVIPGAVYDHTVFYAGIDAGFTLPSMAGLRLRFGLSQNGPLEAYVQASGDVLIVPPANLALKSLAGGIKFDAKPFPTISKAKDLKGAQFAPGNELTPEQWLMQLKQQVVNQAGGGDGGYLFSVSGSAVADDVTQLADGAVSAHLLQTFLDNSDPLSASTASGGFGGVVTTTVVAESAGNEWLINDGGKYYLVDRNNTGGLDVSQYRLAMDSAGTGASGAAPTLADVYAELNGGLMGPKTIAAFAAYGITLTDAATVAVVAPRPGQPVTAWTITAGSYVYHLYQTTAGVLTVQTTGGTMGALNGVIQIEASATIGFYGVPTSAFSATADLIIETDGKILLNAYANFGSGGGLGFNFRAFIDLSHAGTGSATTLFYFEQDVDVPGFGTMPQLTIAAGATFAQTDIDGNLLAPGVTAGAAGFGIRLGGEIVFQQVPGVTLTLNGDSQLTFAGGFAKLQFNARLSASIGSFIQADNFVTAAGAFTMQYGGAFKLWGAAELAFGTDGIPFLRDAGITAHAAVFLRINTDVDAQHEITIHLPKPGVPDSAGQFVDEHFTFQPGSFGLYLVGALDVHKGPVSFTLNGVFDVDFKLTGGNFTFDVFAFADMSLGLDGQTLMHMTALGLLEINNDGFAAMLAINAQSNSSVIDRRFDFTLFTNTTGHTVSYRLPDDLTALIGQMDGTRAIGDFTPPTDLDAGMLGTLQAELRRIYGQYDASNGGYAIPAADGITVSVPGGMPRLAQDGHITGTNPDGPYLIVQGAGDMVVLNTFTLHGDFAIQATPDGIGLQVDAKLDMGPLGGIAASGTLNLTRYGMVAALSLSVDIELGGFASLSGAATLQVNTTGTDQTVKQYTYNPVTHKISNTPSDVVISGSTHVLIDVQGELVLAGFFNLHGEFFLALTHDAIYGEELTMAVHAKIDGFFGLSLDVQGSAAVFTGVPGVSGPGLVLSIYVAAGFNLASVVQMNGTVRLEVNTFGRDMSIADPAAPLSSNITVRSGVHVGLTADISIISFFHFHGDGEIVYDNATGIFTLGFRVGATVNLFIINAYMTVGGWIDSTGQFAVGIKGGFDFDIGVVGLHGSGALVIASCNDNPAALAADGLPPVLHSPVVSGHRALYLFGYADLDGTVLGISIATIHIGFGLNSNLDIYFDATVRLNFLLFSISFSFSVTVGSFSGNRPPEVYLAGTPGSAQLSPAAFPGGTLVVNAGPRAASRNWNSSDTDEKIGVRGSDYNAHAGTETIYLTIDGYTQAYRNVTRVQVPAGGGNNIQVDKTVAIPVDITAGAAGRGATIVDNGTGGGNIVAGPGNDLIIAGANASLLRIKGNGGTDTIVAGNGPEQIDTVGGTASQVLWNADTGGTVTLTGGGGSDQLFVTANTPGTSYAGGERLNLTTANGVGRVAHPLAGSGDKSIYYTNLPNLTVSAPGGGNVIGLGDLSGGTLRHLSLDYGPAHTVGNSVTMLGSTGADTYTLDSTTAPLPTLPDPQVGSIYARPAADVATPAVMVASPATSAANTVGVVSVARAGGLTVELYGAAAANGDTLAVNSNGGSDTFYVPSVAIPTALQGNAVNATATTAYTTTYYVGMASAGMAGRLGRVNALLAIAGTAAGTDTVVMNDETDADDHAFSLTANQLVTDALGAGGRLAYDANVENLNLFAGPGRNTYGIVNTGATGLTQIHTTGSDNAFAVNAPITNPISINGGASVLGNNVLTVNGLLNGAGNDFRLSANQLAGVGAPINFANLDGVVIKATGGNNTFALDGDVIPTTLIAGGGNDAFTVAATAAPTVIDTGDGNDTVTLNGSGAPVTVTAHDGNTTYDVTGNASQMVLNGGTGHDSFTVRSNTGVLTLNGGVGPRASNEFHILGNAGVLNVVTNGSPSTFDVRDIVAPINVDSTGSAATFHVTGPIYAPVNVVGGGSVQRLVVDATTGADHITVTDRAITGLGAAITYTGLMSVTVNGNGGDDTFDVLSNSAPTILNGGNGDSTFNVAGVALPLTINTGTGESTVNLNAPALTGAVAVVGDGRDTLNVAGLSGATTLTAATIAGGNTGGIAYSGLAALNVSMAATDDALAITGTGARTLTRVDTGDGRDVVDVQATTGPLTVDDAEAATAAALADVQGSVVINGTGTTTLSMADSTGAAVTVTDHDVTGLNMGPAGIAYANLAQLNLALGDHANATVASTGTDTRLTGSGRFTVASVTGPTTITTTAGDNAVTVDPAGLHGPLSVVGGGTDTLTIDDTANAAGRTVAIAPTMVAGVAYAGVESLNVTLGDGDDTVTLAGTAAGTTTVVATAGGHDVVDVQLAGADTSVQTGTGDDTVTVAATTGPLSLVTGTGANVVTLGPTLAALAGPVTLVGTTDTLNLSDVAAATDGTGTLAPTSLAGFGSAGVNFAGVSTLTLTLGNGNDALTVTDTAATTAITTGTGTNMVALQQTSSPTSLTLGPGRNTVGVQAIAATTAITSTGTDAVTVSGLLATLDPIAAPLAVHGNANTTLTLDDSGSPFARTGTVTPTDVTGFGTSAAGVAYDGVGTLNVNLGATGNTVAVTNTSAATTVSARGGIDAFAVADTTAPLAIHAGPGATTVAVAATHGATTIATAVGGSTTTTLTTSLSAPVTVAGNGADVLIVDGSADGAARSATLTPTVLAGLSDAPVTFAGLSALTVNLGTADDAIVVTDTSTPTTINGNVGDDTITIAAAHAATTVNTGASHNTVAVLTNAAPVTLNAAAGNDNDITLGTAGRTAGLAGPIVVNGGATLTVDDSADAAAAGVVVTPTTLAGLTPTPIAYANVGALNVRLGAGDNTAAVDDTSAVTTVVGGSGNDTLTINATSNAVHLTTGTGSNAVTVAGNGADVTVDAAGTTAVAVGAGHLAAVAGPVTVNGATTLSVDGSADGPTTLAISPTAITGPVAVNYTTAALSVRLGDAGNTVVVNGTSAPTDVATGGGSDVVAITATTAPLAVHTGGGFNAVSLGGVDPAITANLAGPVTIDGGGSDLLSLDDTGDTARVAGTIAPATLTGFTPAPVGYRGVATLAMSLGSGGNAVTVAGTSAATTVSTGTGANAVTVDATGVANPLTLQGGGRDTLNLNALDGNARDIAIADAQVTGLTVDPIQYAGVAKLATTLGTGANRVTVGTAGSLAGLPAVAVRGGGATRLAVNAFADSAPVTVSATTVTGTGAITYADVATVAVRTGGTATVFAAGLRAPVDVTGTGLLAIDDATDTVGRHVTIAPGTFAGVAAAVTSHGFTNTSVALGSGDDTASVNEVPAGTSLSVDGGAGENTAIVTAVRDLAGSLSLRHFQSGTVAINHDLTGSLNVEGSLDRVTVGRDIAGSIGVTGGITQLSIGGAARGTVDVGSVDGLYVGPAQRTTTLVPAAVSAKLPTTVTAGDNGKVVVTLANPAGSATARGKLTVVVYAVPVGAVAPVDAATIVGVAHPTLTVAAGDSARARVSVVVPPSLANGQYKLAVQVMAYAAGNGSVSIGTVGGVGGGGVASVAPQVFTVRSPVVTAAVLGNAAVTTGDKTVGLKNVGPVGARGSAVVTVYASRDGAGAVVVGRTTVPLFLAAGDGKRVTVAVRRPAGWPAGVGQLFATVEPAVSAPVLGHGRRAA